MRKGVILVAALALALTPVASSVDRVKGPAEFRETQVSYRLIGQGAGRTEVWRTRIYTLKKGQFVGTGVTACIFADAHSSLRQCASTYRLPLGKVSTFGTIFTRSGYKVSIFTGSDFYEKAEGTAIVRRFGIKPYQNWLTFYFV